jgi:hypothetical protein
MANPYLPPKDAKPERARISVRLDVAETEDLEAIAKLWNAVNKELDRKRGRKWKSASLIEFFVRVGMSEFWKTIGGRQAPKEAYEDLVRRAVEATRKHERADDSRG